MSVATPTEQRQADEPASDAADVIVAASSDPPADPRPLAFRPWLPALSVLPFLAVPLAHVASQPQTATGLFHYELPYYVANGRAAFERGNGLLYPNPFDPSADAPVIYVHWLPELMGLATSVFGADPGTLVLWLTLVAALAFAVATRQLVTQCLPDEWAHSPFPLLAVMWGGGVLVIGGAAIGWFSGQPDLLQLDPGNGLWFLNWGRNALFPTEAVYHTLTACCWLAEIRRRPVAANFFLLLLATTHPWSGLELLLTVNLWRGVQMLLRLNWSSAVPAWGLVGVAAICRLWKDPSALRTETVQFLICALTVALGLSLHDRLMKPVQPLHFTRGYVWMPLCLLAAPLIANVVRSAWRSSLSGRAVVCGLALILVSDNLLFGVIHTRRQLQQQDGFHLSVHDRALLAVLHEKFPQTVVLTESAELNYLLPAYTAHRPWLGHQFNTPEYPARLEVMQRCFAGDSVSTSDIPSDVMLLVVRRTREARPLSESGVWMDCTVNNAQWEIWVRTTAADAD